MDVRMLAAGTDGDESLNVVDAGVDGPGTLQWHLGRRGAGSPPGARPPTWTSCRPN